MDDIFVHHSPQCLHIEKWERMNPHLRAGFTTRRGGVSTPPFATMNLGLNIPDDRNDVVENRQHLAERLSIPLENWVSGEQIHGNHVCIVNQKDRGKGSHCYQTSIPGVDGFITNETDILCTGFFMIPRRTTLVLLMQAGKGPSVELPKKWSEHFLPKG